MKHSRFHLVMIMTSRVFKHNGSSAAHNAPCLLLCLKVITPLMMILLDPQKMKFLEMLRLDV